MPHPLSFSANPTAPTGPQTMSPNDLPGSAQPTHEEILSALFANLVMQQTNTALMLLGQVPNPENGERVQDLEGARMFIDQLEGESAETRGPIAQAKPHEPPDGIRPSRGSPRSAGRFG